MKPKGKVYSFFKEKLENRKIVFLCQFCGQRYRNQNATRMTLHLLKNCHRCPDIVKLALKKPPVLSDVTNTSASNPDSSTTSSTSQSTRGSSTNDKPIENFDEKNAQRALALAIYVSGQPLSLVEHPLWKEFFQLLNPNFTPPGRKALSTTLLDEEYTKVQQKINESIHEAKVLHLALDGWTNIRNESIINVIVYTPSLHFYTFIETNENKHTADYLFQQMCKIIDEIGSDKVMLVITDNASNMVRCGAMLSEKYSNIKWSGCLAHTLNLMIGDILKHENIKNLLSDVTDIIKCIRHSHILSAQFKNIGQEKNITKSLQLPGKTRWGSHLFCIESLLECKVVLQNMALNVAGLQRYKNLLLDEVTWNKLENLREILKPIVHWITKLEGDRCSIHLVHTAFSEVQEVLQKSAAVDILGDSSCQELKRKFQDRKSTTIKPIHLAAVLLDPKNRGITLKPEECIDGWEFVMNLAEEHCSSVQMLFKEVSDYKCGLGLWSKPFVWTAAEKISALAWWETLFSQTDLGFVAIRIISAPATSASVERSFSTFANIHTRKRNKFITKRAGKISLISHNWKKTPKNTENNEINSMPSSSTGIQQTNPCHSRNFEEIDSEFEQVDFSEGDSSEEEECEEEVFFQISVDENVDDPLEIESD